MFLDLGLGADAWAEKATALLSARQERGNMRQAIVEKGYDIRVEAKKLENLYLEIYNSTLK